MTSPCRWIEGYGHYLPAHEITCRDDTCQGCQPCTHDDAGNVVRHCKGGRQRCTEHLDPAHPHTCPNCVGKARDNIDAILRYAWQVQEEALEAGVDSEAFMLAGPTADPAVVVWKQLRGITAFDLIPGEAEQHPELVLGSWEVKIRAAYKLAIPTRRARPDEFGIIFNTLGRSTSFLDGKLTMLAQDVDFPFRDLLNDLGACRGHLEAVLAEGRRAQRGAPCHCAAATPLVKVYSHYCTKGPQPERCERCTDKGCDEHDCKREHDLTGKSDRWRCPSCSYTVSDATYRRWNTDDYRQNADRLTAEDIEITYGIPKGTLWRWANEEPPRVKKRGYDGSRRQLYDVADVKKASAERKKPA